MRHLRQRKWPGRVCVISDKEEFFARSNLYFCTDCEYKEIWRSSEFTSAAEKNEEFISSWFRQAPGRPDKKVTQEHSKDA